MEKNNLTLGSLFDGSGGFPLGGIIAGIEPKWASEIEPFPIRVTTKRLPQVKHYGDVSQMDGAKIEPVDIITFGSPCQDMSIAGKREGLGGSRSSLFYEAIRIVKEMRRATDGKYPRYIVWENVTGAFSSNRGADFQSVLEAVCSVKGYKIDTPRPEKWPNAGEIVADDFSLAWRVLDAQYWGAPQRRKRIYLVADFAGGSAGKILFESEGMSGYSGEGFKAWQRAAGSPENRSGKTGLCLNDQGGQRMEVSEDVTGTLRAGTVPAAVYENHSQDSRYTGPLDTADTVTARYGTGGNNQPLVVEEQKTYDVQFTSEGTDYKDPPTVSAEPEYIVRRLTPTECARLQGFPDWWCSDLGTENPTDEEMVFWRDVFETHRKAVTRAKKPKTDNQIRKWLKNPHSDSKEYAMWGNGVALPCVYFVLAGIVYYDQFYSQNRLDEGKGGVRA